MMKLAAILLFCYSSCACQGFGGKTGIGGSAGIGGGPSTAISIAFDNASTFQSVTTVTSLTYSFTVGSGTNRMLLVGVSSNGTTAPSSVTYAGSSMTLIKTQTFNFGAAAGFLYAIVSPTSGANNIVITFAGSTNITSTAASYSGVFQSTTPDASTSNGTGGTSHVLTLTTVANNCWTFAWSHAGGAVSAGTGATLRSQSGQVSGSFDSNGPITPPGSTSETINFPSSQAVSLMVSFTHA